MDSSNATSKPTDTILARPLEVHNKTKYMLTLVEKKAPEFTMWISFNYYPIFYMSFCFCCRLLCVSGYTASCQCIGCCISYYALKAAEQYSASAYGVLWHHTNWKNCQSLCEGRVINLHFQLQCLLFSFVYVSCANSCVVKWLVGLHLATLAELY